MLCLLSFIVSVTQIQTVYTSTSKNQTTAKKRAALYSTGTFDLPEIIINKAFNGYHYPVPNPPFQFDEPSYLPPLNDLSPPYFDPTEPPNNPSNDYLPAVTTKSFATNMSCLDTSLDKYFRAIVRLNQNPPSLNPVIDAATVDDCVKIVNNGELMHVDLTGSKMAACGVRLCGDRSLCLRVRLPVVQGLRMLDDQQLVLQCKLQEPVLASTKRFRIGPVRMLQGRGLTDGNTASAVVGGSRQGRHFDMEVALYRQRHGSANEPLGVALSAGSAIYLGDELLLRAAIRDGDGWKYGRLSTVTIHSAISPANFDTTSNALAHQSVTLIDENGCRIDAMRAVCPDQPRQLGHLTVTMPFRAFAFQRSLQPTAASQQGQVRSGEVGSAWELPMQEDMVLSVRMVACLEAHDCAVQGCDLKSTSRSRAKRDVNIKRNINANRSASTDVETYLDFRVILKVKPEDGYAKPTKLYSNVGDLMNSTLVLIVSGLFILAMIGVLLFLKNKKVKQSSF